MARTSTKALAYIRQWKKDNPKKVAVYRKNWLKSNPLNRSKTSKYEWKSRLKHRFSLTEEMYALMIVTQKGGCAICGKKQSSKRLAVDHNHKTNAVRGLLCASCNRGLGYFRDDIFLLKKAVSYLELSTK